MGNRKKDTAESKSAAAPSENGKFSLISNEKLIALYSHLLKWRKGPTPGANSAAGRGRAAGIVGAAIDLGPGDLVCSREHGLLAGFADGGTIDQLLAANHRGPETSAGNGAARNGHSPSTAQAAHTQAAIGTALSNRTRKNGKVAVIFAEAQDQFREALHVATIHSLPMIFVHQPSGKRDQARAVSPKLNGNNSSAAETPWFPSITVDANDVVAVYRVANEAISRARLGRGPTLIECRPFPVTPRPGPNGGYAHDPIRNMEHYLRARGLFDPKLKNRT